MAHRCTLLGYEFCACREIVPYVERIAQACSRQCSLFAAAQHLHAQRDRLLPAAQGDTPGKQQP